MCCTSFRPAFKPLLSCILTLVVTPPAATCALAADRPSLEEIVTTLEKQREQVKSLYIETKYYITTSVKPKVLRSSWRFSGTFFTYQDERHFAFKEGKRYLRLMQFKDMDKASGTRHVTNNDEQAEDGKIHWERRVDLKRGPAKVFVRAYDPKEQWIQNPEYCNNIGWDCKTEMNTQDESVLRIHRNYDLLYLLKKGAFSIGKEVTTLAGVKCVVIRRRYEAGILLPDRSRPMLQATEKIWLDVGNGFAVRQREQDIETYGLDRTVNSDFVEILPGIWFPKKTEVRCLAPPDMPKEFQGRPVLSYHVDLIRWAVNNVSDERFHIVTKPSDILMDNRTGDLRVIEAPAGLKDLTTMEGSRNASVSAGVSSSSETSPAPLTAEAASLVNFLVEAGSSARSGAAQLRVAIASGEGCAPAKGVIELLKAKLHCKCEIITLADICGGALKRFEVIIFPGGRAIKQGTALGVEGRRAVREFVGAGGGYVGICAGGSLATAGFDWKLGLINAKTLSGRRDSPGPDGVMSVEMGMRGSGTVKMELTDAGHKVLGRQLGLVDTLFAVGPVFLPAGRTDLPEYVCLAFYRTEVWLHKLQRGSMIDSPNILVTRFGKGHVIIFSSHPEARSETQTMLARAVLTTARKPANPH